MPIAKPHTPSAMGGGIDATLRAFGGRLLPLDRWRRVLGSSSLLIAAGLLAVVPTLVAAILAIAEVSREGDAEARLADAARVIAANVDALVHSREERARVLSVLPAFDQFPTMTQVDWKRLSRRLEGFGEAFPESQVAVWQIDGAIPLRIATTLAAHERFAAPATTPAAIEAIGRAARTREPAVSGTFQSTVSGLHVLMVAVPVLRGDRVTAVISASIRLSELQDTLRRQRLPEGTSVGISDSGGTVLARRPERYIGEMLPEETRSTIRSAPAGVTRLTSLEGVAIVAAFTQAELANDLVVTAWAPVALLEAAWHRSRSGLLAGGVLTFAIAIGAMLLWASAWRAARETAREREAHLHTALEASRLSTWEARLDSGVASWSSSCAAIFGWREGRVPDAPRGPWWALAHPADTAAVGATWQAFRNAPSSTFLTSFRIVRRDNGETRWCKMLARHSGDGRALGVVFDITEARHNEARVLLAREVDHRANNLLAVVQAMVSLTRAEDAESLRSALRHRFASLARTQSLLSRRQTVGIDLSDVVEGELGAYGEAVRATGEPIPLRPEAVQPIAMAVHELATNAAKYGALSVPEGKVAIHWRIVGGALRVRWQETGGPPVVTPSRSGFGTRMIRGVLAQLGGTANVTWEQAGIGVDLVMPTERAVDTVSLPAPTEERAAA